MTRLLDKYFWWIVAIVISLFLVMIVYIPSWIIIEVLDITQIAHKLWVVGGVIFAECVILVLWAALYDTSIEAVTKREAEFKNGL